MPEGFEPKLLSPEERERRRRELTRLKMRKYLPFDLGEAAAEFAIASGEEVDRFERLNFDATLAEIAAMREQKKNDFSADPELRQLEIDVLTRIWNHFAARADEEVKDKNTE
jgi:hypothetical protein